MPNMLSAMSISHPDVKVYQVKPDLIASARLAAWMGMVHYTSTEIQRRVDRNR